MLEKFFEEEKMHMIIRLKFCLWKYSITGKSGRVWKTTL